MCTVDCTASGFRNVFVSYKPARGRRHYRRCGGHTFTPRRLHTLPSPDYSFFRFHSLIAAASLGGISKPSASLRDHGCASCWAAAAIVRSWSVVTPTPTTCVRRKLETRSAQRPWSARDSVLGSTVLPRLSSG